MNGLIPIAGVCRDYAWGSTAAIPDLLDVASTGRPMAELWFGAHADAPSLAATHGRTLDALITDDPDALLGSRVVAHFGPRLPFLLKLLAAEQPLSIQVHPNRGQAQAGFAAEDARSIPRDAPERNYRDPNHKPELIYALTPFEALCGFRPIEATLRLIKLIDLRELDFLADLLAGEQGLRSAFTALLRLEDPASLVASVAAGVAALSDVPAEFETAIAAVGRCVMAFPGDVGVVLSLLLNAVTLAPGEAIYLGAGNVHCYLRGFGVEIMANSDNVLRCGLTPKHIDVDELLAITDFSVLSEPRWTPSIPSPCLRLDVPVDDFALAVFESPACEQAIVGPAIVLALGEEPTVRRADEAPLALSPGHAVFVPSGVSATCGGTGRIAVASVGRKI